MFVDYDSVLDLLWCVLSKSATAEPIAIFLLAFEERTR